MIKLLLVHIITLTVKLKEKLIWLVMVGTVLSNRFGSVDSK